MMGALGLAAYFVLKNFGQDLAKNATNAVGNTAAGVVTGIGSQLGVPETNPQKCSAAIGSNDWWNASFYCPAGSFISSGAAAVSSGVANTIYDLTPQGQQDNNITAPTGPTLVTLPDNNTLPFGAMVEDDY